VTASYPSSVKSFTTKVDFTDVVLAAHVNDLQDEVSSLESTFGTSIKTGSGWVGSFDVITSSWNTVKDRINNIEYGLKTAYDARNPTGGTTGQVLVKNSSTNYDYSWTTFTGLPTQTGNNGYFLTTNGSSASWSAISQVPSQSTHSGKFLTTDGSAASWATISQVPSQTGENGKYLTTDGTTASWATVSTGSGSNEFTLMLMGG